MKKIFLVMCVVAVLAAMSGMAQAAVVNGVDFWFATDAIGTPISSLDVVAGKDFDVSVWYNTSPVFLHTSLELMVGWSKSPANSPAAKPKGTAAVAGDTMITNRNGAVGFTDVMTGGWAAPKANDVGGPKNADDSQGSYGSHLTMIWATAGESTSVTAPEKMKIGTLNLTNSGIAVGDFYTMKIWRAAAPATGNWSSYIGVSGNQNQEQAPTILTVNSIADPTNVVPEPSSMIALGSGVLGLFGLIRRKRS